MSTQGLGKKGPVNRSSSTPLEVGANTTVRFGGMGYSGVVPTSGEVAAALKAVYEAAGDQPKEGDVVLLSAGGAIFSGRVTATGGGPGGFFFPGFSVSLPGEDTTSWAAIITQHGLF